MLDHVFFDVRLSHLDPAQAEIVDVAALRTNRKGDVLASVTNRVFPTAAVAPETYATNGYDPDLWHREAVTYKVAVETFRAVIRAERFDDQYVVVAHFADRFPVGTRDLFPGAAWIDTGHLSWPLLHHGLVSSRSLATLAKHVGIKPEALTTAAGTAFTTMRVYWELMRRYKTALAGEELLRSVGGDALESIRRKLNV